jgi:ABC-type amino acid transport system permease subunit
LWLGKKKSNCQSNCSKEFNFMGNDILFQVIHDLLEYNSMDKSDRIVLSGMRFEVKIKFLKIIFKKNRF